MNREYTGRIFAGLLIVLIGIVFLLGSLDMLDVGEVFSTYWPMILIFVGIWQIVSSRFRAPETGLLLIAFGLFFQLRNWDFVSWNVLKYAWPFLVIALGLWLIFKPRFRGFKGDVPESRSLDLDSFTMFSGLKKQIGSQEFRGGKATALLGGLDIDFGQAKLAGGKAAVDLTALLGGIDVRVPRDWRVVVDASAILGGVDNKHREVPEPEAKATLFIRATAILGGIDIKES